MQIQLMAPPQRQNTAKLDTVYIVIEANNTQKREKKKRNPGYQSANRRLRKREEWMTGKVSTTLDRAKWCVDRINNTQCRLLSPISFANSNY